MTKTPLSTGAIGVDVGLNESRTSLGLITQVVLECLGIPKNPTRKVGVGESIMVGANDHTKGSDLSICGY